ncbi:MAG: PAS domain S-box protein, partial [Burkholderiales bacterium]
MGAPSSPAPATGGLSPLRSHRWWLWGALLLLVGPLLGVLVFLAAAYEEGRDQAALERDAEALATDMRSALFRNVQTLQSLHSIAPTPGSWIGSAAEVLQRHREMVRLEWRDPARRLLASRDSAYVGDLFSAMGRNQSLVQMRQACETARRLSGPAFSPSYFWPLGDGTGYELMDMCLPVARAGESSGFLVVTYSLPGLLTELTDRERLRGRSLAFTEPDGTRLAMHGSVSDLRRLQRASAVLDLPGHTLMLRLEGPRIVGSGFIGLFPNLLTAVVGALSLSLLAVLVLLGRDMRRRQQAEHELADALAFRQAMENSLVTGLRARDMQGRITYVNPAFCQMVGYRAEELVGAGVPFPWWPTELADEYGQRQAVRLAGQTLPREGYESVFQRRDGTRFPVLIIEAPLMDAQGVQTGFMGAILDLTEQRRIEELNRASQERLQATARLATMGEMASLLSHELNQPLAAISSYATGSLNLLDQPAALPQGDIRQAMRRIAEQADRAGRVIKSVADFVRRRDQVREAVNPSDLIEAIRPLLDLQAKKQGIRLQLRVAPGCPAVVCDRTMIEQVLLNLARNGMQAMPVGEPPMASGLRVLGIDVGPSARPQGGERGRAWVEFAVT